MLMLGTKSLVPSQWQLPLELHHAKVLTSDAVTDVAERPAMIELHDTYGKTVHMW